MKTKLLLLILLFIASTGFAQKWVDMMNDPDANYYDVVKEANLYFETHDKGKGSGWKQFKRWEYEMQFLIDADGKRIDGQLISNELEQFKALHKDLRTASVTSNWTELGPKSWNRTSSWNPGVGRITCIAVNPADQNEIFVGSPGGGVWKTINGGSSWTCLTDNMTVLNIYSITIDPTNSNIIYVGSSGGGILKSTNGGSSFTSATSGVPTSATTRRILVDPGNNNIVLAATSTGIYRSSNGGTSWTQTSTASFNDMEFKPGNTSVVYASGNTFYKSTNNGQSFTQITNGIPTSGRSFISVTPANAEYVYMVQANGSEFGYLYRSTDGGTTFTTRVTGSAANGTNYFGYSSSGTQTGGQAWYDMAMCVSPVDAEEVHIAGIITWKSTNGGSSFVATTEWSYPNSRGYTHCDMHVLEYIGNTIYTGSDGGIYKSTDGADNFTDLSTGLGIRQFYRIGGSKTDPTRIAGGAQDNGSSILKSGGWIDWLGADGMETFIDYTNADIIYGTSQNGGLYKSINGGNSTTSMSKPAGSGAWITPFIIDPLTPSTLYSGYGEVYKSTNAGGSWISISSLGAGTITSLAIAPSDPNYIYASNGSTLWVTKNGGNIWSAITTGLSGSVQYITVHKSNPEKVAVTTSGGTGRVYKSTNAGTTWTNISGTLPALSGKCVVYHDGAEEGLYLALTVGVYYRDNNMADWVPFMTNLPQVQLSELEIHPGIGKIRVATYGRGVWESNLPCSSPVALSASNVTTSAATLNWGSQANSPTYNVKWKQAGSGTWLGSTTTSATSLNISGLTSGTNYEFTVSANCTGGTTADAPYCTFTTQVPCSVPTNLTATNVSSSTATLGWGPQSNTPSYHVMWRPVGGVWSSGTATTNSLNITGLLPLTTYEFTVRSNCTTGATAYATPYKTFTTTVGPALADIIISNQYFTLADYLNSYIIDYIAIDPNLSIDTVPKVVAGEPVDLYCHVRNNGATNAAWNYTGFYLSKTSSYSYYNSMYLGDYYHYSIPGNTGYNITKRCTIPLNAELGEQYLLFKGDDYGNVTESNENNNIKYIKVYVIGAPRTKIDWTSPSHEPDALFSAPVPLKVYPNPASGMVELSFSIQHDSPAELSIYDQLGKKVAELFNSNLQAGTHTFGYNLDELAAGIYTCRLVTDTKTETIRLIKE